MHAPIFKDLHDELEDLTEQSNEIQEVMGRSYGMPEIDDDELEAELEALGEQSLERMVYTYVALLFNLSIMDCYFFIFHH